MFASAALLVVVMAGSYGALWVASQASPQLRERAGGVLDPLGDESVRLRFETWKQSFDDAAEHPFGQGVGAVGAASAPSRVQVRTTDNSFIKILIEQGVLGLILFALGILGAVVLLARRLRAASSVESAAVGLAALTGFVAFLGICLAGEAVEQPGKIVAWALLGTAAAQAFGGLGPRDEVA
jgi:O-antigen ligase